MADPTSELVAREVALRRRLDALARPRAATLRWVGAFVIGVLAAGLAGHAVGFWLGDRWAARTLDSARRGGATTCAAVTKELERQHDVDLLARCCAEHGGCGR